MGFKQTASTATARARTTRSASSAASSATCPRRSGSSSSPTPASTAGRRRAGNSTCASCDTDAGAAAYAKERVDLAKKHGLEIFTVATHLQGQVPRRRADAPRRSSSARQGEARQAYKAWRDEGNNPPRTDPYYVPDDVGKLIHDAGAEGPAGVRPAAPGT